MSAIFFDLDNTLFNVKQYFYGAFKKISRYLSKKHNISRKKIQKKLKELWKNKSSMYPNLFDDLLKFYELDENIEDIVEIFNNYDGKIKPYNDVLSTLGEFKRRNYTLGIITDGNIQRQKRKIRLLGIQDFFDIVICTYELNSPKPSEAPFKEAIHRLKAKPDMIYYVGDNPLIDFKGAKKIGYFTIRLKKGEFIQLPNNEFIDIQIKRIKYLLKLIVNFNK